MTFLFKIQIKEISSPPVWRRVMVPANLSFYKFHFVIQAAFGWTNSHLFQFSPGGYGSSPTIAEPYADSDDYEEVVTDSRKIRLNEVFVIEKQKFIYIYDFGDNWNHTITLEKIIPQKAKMVQCVDGKGACPPDSCGGVGGYQDLKVIMNDPQHPEHEEMRVWLGLQSGEKWNANAFDIAAISRSLSILQKSNYESF